MTYIKTLTARSILDSRGNPTIEVTVTLSNNQTVVSSAPSGASTGKFEAHERRDNDPQSFHGKGVFQAVEQINTAVAHALSGKNPADQHQVDELLIALDGTEDKSNLGGNAIIAVSMAVCKAGGLSENIPLYKHIANLIGNQTLKLPRLLSNLINGGLHAGKNLDIQEFLVIPYTATSVHDSLKVLASINDTLKETLLSTGQQPLVGDEGGFAPKFGTNEEAFGLLESVILRLGYKLGNDVFLGMDAAANSFFQNGLYKIRDLAGMIDGKELGRYYKGLCERYQILYLEDPFAEEDISSWESFLPIVAQNLIVTGDDLTVTNPKRLATILKHPLIRGVIIKPNQIGTVSEAMQVVKMAKQAGLTTIASHRSGETDDDFIADFCVGVGADFAKFGAPVRGERVAKYNRLMAIEDEIR